MPCCKSCFDRSAEVNLCLIETLSRGELYLRGDEKGSGVLPRERGCGMRVSSAIVGSTALAEEEIPSHVQTCLIAVMLRLSTIT
jgi:hypothetical protein